MPPIACPHVQAFSQTSHFARFTSPQQPALPSSPQNPSRMRSHTSPVSSNSQGAFQTSSQSPRPRHAFSLETVPSVGEMSVEDNGADADIQADTTKADTTRAIGNSVTQSQNQVQKTPRMPTPPPTPPPRRPETSGIRSTGQPPSVSGSSASHTPQNRTRRSTEPMHTSHQMPQQSAFALATAIRSSSRSSTPATASAFPAEAKSRRKSTPVSSYVQATTLNLSERQRSIPASTGAGPEPRCHPRNVNNPAGHLDFVQCENQHLGVKKADARTQHVRQATMPANLSSSLPSPSSASYLQTRHRLSNSTSNPLPPSPTVHISHPSPSSSASMSSPSPTSPSQPPSPSTTASSFNAHTASMRCRQIDGYVSFAAVAGLEEPHGDDEYADGPEGLAGRSSSDRGWVGRLLGL